jgi:hypothetical protein
MRKNTSGEDKVAITMLGGNNGIVAATLTC